MSEPTLEDMSDYNNLSGDKKKIVTIVIVAGILMGILYVTIDHFFGSVDDNLNVTDSVKTVPYR